MNESLTQLDYVKEEGKFYRKFLRFLKDVRFGKEKLRLSYVPAVAVKHTEQTLFSFIRRKGFGCGLFVNCLNTYYVLGSVFYFNLRIKTK